MQALADGTIKEKGELLRRFVAAHENLQACESSIHAARTAKKKNKLRQQLVAVKDMTKSPYNFSAKKVDALVLEETKFWVTVEESRENTEGVEYKEELNLHMQPDTSAATRILNDLPSSSAAPSPSPLSGEILRAYDAYNSELASAANVPQGRGASRAGGSARSCVSRRTAGSSSAPRKIALIEEQFRSETEKHAKWSAELRKEMSSCMTLSVELPQDDELKTTIDESLAELKSLALRLKNAKTFDAMDPICREIHEVVTDLKVTKGKAKGLVAELKKTAS